MPTIEGSLERGVVSKELLGTPSRERAQQQPGVVMFPRGGRAGVKQAANYGTGIASILKKGADIYGKVEQKQKAADYIAGQMAYASGKTEAELDAEGASKSTVTGYNALKVATDAETWYAQKMLDIGTKDRELSPEDYRNQSTEAFKSLLGDNKEANEMMTAAFAKMLPRLAAEQTKANRTYTYEKTKTALTDLLMSASQTGEDLDAILNTNNINGLRDEDVNDAIASAISREAKELGTDRIARRMGLKASKMPSRLGSIAAATESRGDARTIGRMSTDGRAFGTYQISEKTGTFDTFLNWAQSKYPDLYEALKNPETREQAWIGLAENGKVQEAERQFIEDTHYNPVMDRLSPELRGIVYSEPMLQEAMFAASVNHGGRAAEIANKVYTPGMSSKEFIDKFYEERMTRFSSSTPKEQAAVKRSLTEQRNTVLAGLSSRRGFSDAQSSKIDSSLNQLYSNGRTAFRNDMNAKVSELLASVSNGEVTPEEARESWEAMRDTATQDMRYSYSEDILSTINSEMASRLGTSVSQAKKQAATKEKVETAIASNNMQSLNANEKALAWTTIDNDIARRAGVMMQMGASADDAQEWMLNQKTLAMQQHGLAVDEAKTKAWTNAVVSGPIINKNGEATYEASNALIEYTRLQRISPELADRYVKDTYAKALLNTAAAIYESTPDVNVALMGAKMALDEGKNITSVAAHMGTPAYAVAADEAITNAIDKIDPGVFKTMFGKGKAGMLDVSDSQIEAAKASAAFRNSIKQQMAVNFMQSPGLAPEVNAKMAATSVLNRSEFIMGNIVTVPQTIQRPSATGQMPKQASLLNDMTLEDYSGEPLTAHIAVQEFIDDNLKELFGNEYSEGFFDSKHWTGARDANVMYNSTDKTFIVGLRNDDGRVTSYQTIPARMVGEWYKDNRVKRMARTRERKAAMLGIGGAVISTAAGTAMRAATKAVESAFE